LKPCTTQVDLFPLRVLYSSTPDHKSKIYGRKKTANLTGAGSGCEEVSNSYGETYVKYAVLSNLKSRPRRLQPLGCQLNYNAPTHKPKQNMDFTMDDSLHKEPTIDGDEIQKAFDTIDAIINRRVSWDKSEESVRDVMMFIDAMIQFEDRHERTLQNFYKLIRSIEDGTKMTELNVYRANQGDHCFQAYEAALRSIKTLKFTMRRKLRETVSRS